MRQPNDRNYLQRAESPGIAVTIYKNGKNAVPNFNLTKLVNAAY